MIDITRLELGWCAACNSISECNEITFKKINSQRRVVLCDDCMSELADKLGISEPMDCELPAYMMEVQRWSR